MSRRQANFLCLLCAAIWGGGFIATSKALETFPPFLMLAVRFVGAALLSWIPVWFQKEPIRLALIKKGALSGLFLYLAFAFQTVGLDLTETGMNAFLTSVNVVLVPYIAWLFLKQKPTGRILAASLICLAGIGCLSLSEGSFQFRFGDLLSLICAFFFACQIVALNGVQDENPWTMNAVQMTTAALLSLPFAFLPGQQPKPIDLQAVLSCLYSIVLATFVCYLLQTAAQKYTSPSNASVLLSTESLWANLFGWLILKETKSWIMVLGGLMIFAAVLMVEGKPEKAEEKDNKNSFLGKKKTDSNEITKKI